MFNNKKEKIMKKICFALLGVIAATCLHASEDVLPDGVSIQADGRLLVSGQLGDGDFVLHTDKGVVLGDLVCGGKLCIEAKTIEVLDSAKISCKDMNIGATHGIEGLTVSGKALLPPSS